MYALLLLTCLCQFTLQTQPGALRGSRETSSTCTRQLPARAGGKVGPSSAWLCLVLPVFSGFEKGGSLPCPGPWSTQLWALQAKWTVARFQLSSETILFRTVTSLSPGESGQCRTASPDAHSAHGWRASALDLVLWTLRSS